MNVRRLVIASVAALMGIGALVGAQPALACAVCYGEPGSPMVAGAQAGVLVLLGVVVAVLTGFASLLVFWMRRASRLSETQRLVGPAAG